MGKGPALKGLFLALSERRLHKKASYQEKRHWPAQLQPPNPRCQRTATLWCHERCCPGEGGRSLDVEGNAMNSTGKPSKCSKPVDNFRHSILSLPKLAVWPHKKIVGRNGERLRTCKEVFFGLGVRWPENLAILGTFLPAAQELDGFPMTWKRNNPLFVRKSAFHILYRSFPELPHHGITLQSSKHDLLYSIVAVFQWPEREKTLYLWENLYFKNLIKHFLTNIIPTMVLHCKVPDMIHYMQLLPSNFFDEQSKKIWKMKLFTGPIVIDYCSWQIWRSTEEYIYINSAY